MPARKRRRPIEEHLTNVEAWLANAEAYVAKNVNIKGKSRFYTGDWKGQSGHPSWMRNVMIPAWTRHRAKQERTLEAIAKRAKARELRQRKVRGAQCASDLGEFEASCLGLGPDGENNAG